METETKTRPVVREHMAKPGAYVIETGRWFAGALTVTREQLQAIVQQAYDQHGILAEPSLSVELARAEDGLREFADRWGQSLRGQQ